MQKQKTIGGIVILVVLFAQSFANWVIFSGGDVQAAGPVEENKLVALFVEQNIYSTIKSDIERYTTKYIQGRFERTKVLVFPVDTTKIQPTDIQKIISNLYHGGEKDTASSLISTILVGNIPLPVIKKDQYIFPSVLPYTDIEKPLYVYDTTSLYYIPTTATPDNHQEISHGIIKFQTIQEYTTYFQKLKTYAQNPSSFAEQQFWFEDFTKAEETFTDQNVPLYLQSQIHDEDITYHRYAPVLFSMLQKNNNDTSVETLQNIGVQSIPTSPDYPAEFASSSQAFNNALSTWSNSLSTIAGDAQQQLQSVGNGEQIPTLVMGQSIIQQTKPYESLFSAEYGDTIAKEIETSARWTGTNIGSHITKASTVDQQTSRALLGLNTLLEKVVDKKIQDESWDLNIPIPVVREQYKCILGIPTTIDYKLENFYFGKNARHINNALDTTWYRGTFGNYTLDTVGGIARGGQQGDTTNSLQRSIGSSMGITNQQIVASRGYNATNAKKDADAYQYRKKKCGRNDVSFETYVEQFRGGNTPINLDGNTMQLKYNKWDQAFNPSYNTGIGGALFDIAGSRLVPSTMVDGTNATAARTYGRFLQVEPGLTGPLALIFGSAYYPWCNPKNPIPVAASNLFSIAAAPANKDIQIVASGATTYDDSKTCKDRYVYKTINSIIKHTSPIKDEIDKMNITTQDRPIDATRYISFQGLGGTIVNLQYPNLYNVEVYNRDGNSITLKSVDEIEQSIKSYLENKIDEYNILLSGQNALISGYLTTNTAGFALLATKDTKATPAGRQYTLLPRDYFTSAIGANTIRQLAQSLYVKNSGWPVKSPSSNVGDAIKNLESQFSIANKIYATVENNIVVGQQGIGVNTGGYEAGYIRANGVNNISAKTVPSIIESADIKKQTTQSATNELTTNSDKLQAAIDQSCGVSGDGTVPLLKWPKSLVCRWKNLKKNLKNTIKVSYKNAQGPVLPLKQFAGDLQETYADYETYVQDVLGGDIIEDNTLSSIKLQLPTTKVLRGAQIPFSALVKNTKGEEIPNLLFPIDISVSAGEILSPGQASTRIETTVPSESLVFDTRTIDPSVSTVTITTTGPLEPGRATGDMIQDTQTITLVEGALQVQINNQTTNNFNMILQNSGYTTVNAGVSSVQENLLPTLSLRLSDTNGQPLTSPATITSEKGIIQPGSISTSQEQTVVGAITRTQFTKQHLWTINNGELKVKLLPSMVAGNDTITISIPGLPDRTIDIKILPSSPFSVSVNDDVQSSSPAVRIAVQDRRGNTVQGSTQVQYQIIGDATSNGTRQGTIAISGSSSLPLSYGQRGGTIYVYGSLVSPANAIPGYIRKDVPSRLFPTTGLNIVYVTLEGKGWGDIQQNTISELISSSPKTLAVTTELFSRGGNLPVVGVISQDGTVSESNTLKVETDTTNTSKQIISVNNQVIGYIQGNTPHTLNQFIIQNARYSVQQIGLQGSTNNIGFSIVEAGGEGLDAKEQDFAPLRSYAGGMTVGESQKILFDEARINYGDPFLQHKDAMKIVATSADTTVTLFRDDEKSIKKTMEIDLDKDGKKDLVVLYDDDTIRFLKQYGGTPPYRQLGNLMAVADGVADMWIGDSDNNGLEDIFIRTKKNTLRVYKNVGGSFDVHGSPVCIDVPSGNTSLKDVRQLFIADMNNDTLADIITYDVSGKIRIFYGGNKNGEGYYISNSPTGCDAGRQARNSSLTVATYGLQLVQNTPIYDDSLIHRQGLTLPDNTEEDAENNDTVPANIAQALPNPANPTSINLQQLINAGIPETIRFTATPYDELPVYESNGTLDTIAYIPIQYLTGNDIIDAYKTFAYGQGDEVIVTINLRARQNTIATYLERLRGPRELVTNDSGGISGFNRMNLPSSSIINRNVDGYEFLIDNIALQAGQSISFSYPVRYRPVQSTTIDVVDTNNDGWLDITTTPVDSCLPTALTYISNQGATYTSTTQTTNTSYTSGINQLQSDLNNQLQTTNTVGQNLANGSGSLSQIPGMDQVYESWQDFLQNGIDTTNLSFNANFDLNVLNDPKIEKAIDDVVKGLCQGFQAEGGKGLPVPFNVAFLAPGDFNVFGCKVGSDKGLPIFFFPGTLQTPVGPVPIPYGLKGPGDGFYWAAGGTYPSFIRIYAAPTLTMGIGVAICIGPYAAGIRLPNPIKHIAGNCIVIAKRLGKGKDRPYQTPTHPNNPNNSGITNTAGGGTNGTRTCSNPVASSTRPSSPFTMSAYNGSRDLPIRPAPVNNTQSLGIVQGTYLGIVNFDTQPYATQLSQQDAGKVQIKGGKPFKLQIEGGNVKGLVKCIINKWLDNQLRYVINNLSNMSINVYLPDVSQILEGFKNVRLDEINKLAESFKNTPGSSSTPAGDTLKNLVTKADGDNNNVTQSEMSDLGSTLNNPFNALSSRFEQVPLIKVSTKNVTVQVPYIYSEELTRYTTQLKDYKTQIDKQYAEWQRFIRDARGICDKEPTANQQEACNRQIANYVDVTTKMEQLQRSIRQNLSTLEAYKRFPLELQQWLTVSQRYVTEITDTTQGISSDITAWLNTNATRFEKYVDAIILMISAIKSWQILIDFSTSWKSKCGQCTVDNYDYYSCTLGLLCPKLPILPIPPFRLPNIYVDLSHIRLGMDVVLPNIHFVPKTITLPALPELPTPPTINVDLTIGAGAKITGSPNIPSIPELPAPPRLPELPSFIPSIDLNLPTLPPAPKVPRLAPAITSTLKVVSLIGKIMCIVKNGIGLVGEKGVKTRIEQMTQRTWNVEPFDSLSITRIQPPLRGFDLRVDSYLNFELNFDVLYNVLDKITNSINKKTNSILNAATIGSNAISSVSQSITQGAQQGVDNVNINTQGNINIQGYTEPEMVDPSVLRNDLQKEISALKHSEYSEQFINQIVSVENNLTRKSNIKANTAGVQKATQALEGLLKRTSDTLEQHKNATKSYDSFLQQINSSFLINNDNDIEGDISATLYTADEQVVETIKNTEHPMKTYIDMQENIVDGFVNALKNNSPEKLNMGQFTYDKLSNYFNKTKEKITSAKGYIQYESTNTTPLQTITNTARETAQAIIAPRVEAATPAIPISPSNMTNIWRDEHSIYTNQTTYLQKKSDGTTFTRFYDFEPISKYSDFADRVDEQGYISRYNTSFNVWNFYVPITHFEVAGQSNTATNIRWQNDGRRAYLVMLSDTIYANHEHNYTRDVSRKYVIAYDSGFDVQNSFIELPNIGSKRVSDILGYEVLSTPTFDPADTDIDIILSLTGNKRSYASITPLIVNTRGSITTLQQGAARSAQETLGVQRWGDTTSPVAVAKIRNKRTNEIVAEGTKLTVPRNEQYDLIIQWTDDGVVVENNVIDSTNAMQTFNGDSATLENIYTTKTINIIATARDQSNNQGSQTIIVSFTDPAIAIQTVTDQGDQREIGTKLSEVYPNGYVRFFSQKPTGSSLLTGKIGGQALTDFDTNNTPSLTGKIFYDADTISLFDTNQKRIARIEKKTGKIIVSQDMQSIITLALDFTQNTPSILILNKNTNTTLFSLYLKSMRLQNIQSANGYSVKSLTDTIGTFAGGSCIQDTTNTCVVYITSDGNIYTPDTQKGRVSGLYNYDGGVRYMITIDGQIAANVLFTPMPLE